MIHVVLGSKTVVPAARSIASRLAYLILNSSPPDPLSIACSYITPSEMHACGTAVIRGSAPTNTLQFIQDKQKLTTS